MALLRRNESKSEATQRLRDNQWHGGKGSHKHYYTLQDISQATGRAIGTVRNDVSSGRLVMGDLSNVSSYVWLMRGAGEVAV